MMRAIKDVKKQLHLWGLCVTLKGIKLLPANFQLAQDLVFGLLSASKQTQSDEYSSAVMKDPGTPRLPVAAN